MTRKILSIIAILSLVVFTLQINVFASSIPLEGITVTVSKEKINPGEEVTVNINFGTDLGAYTFDVAYDKNIFDFVRAEGGTENDNGTRVRVTFYDTTGGTNPRNNMSVTFKAKANLDSTNPTDFAVTAEGLANNDASQEYDDITTPIKKFITVEPKNNNNINGDVNQNLGNDNKNENISNLNKEENNSENNSNKNDNQIQGQQTTEMPKKLPKTGNTQYLYIITIIAILGTMYVVVKNFNNKN